MGWDVVNRISRYLSANGRTATASGKIYEAAAYGTGTPSSVLVSSGETVNTFGSYVEIEDSLSADSELSSFVTIGVDPADDSVFEFATGTAGNEVTFARVSIIGVAGALVYNFNPRIKLAAGTRISVRVSDNLPSAYIYHVTTQWYQGTEAI